jgi:hypothetical protein
MKGLIIIHGNLCEVSNMHASSFNVCTLESNIETLFFCQINLADATPLRQMQSILLQLLSTDGSVGVHVTL